MLILHFLGLAMGIGTSFAFMFLGMASSKMDKEAGQNFMVNSLTLSRMGHIGLGLLLLSGGYLMTPYWKLVPSSPLLITKLALVVVLVVLITVITTYGNKAKKGDVESNLNKIRPLGGLSLLTGLAIVVVAVLAFH